MCTEIIEVDVDHLELTPDPWKIKRIKGMQGAENPDWAFEGYVVQYDCDPNDVLGVESIGLPPFPFKARISKDQENELKVDVPLLKFKERGGVDELIRVKLQSKTEGTVAENAMDNARKDFEARTGDWNMIHKKQVKLVFKGAKLKADVLDIHKGKKKYELKTEGYTVFAPIEKFYQGLTQADIEEVVLKNGSKFNVVVKKVPDVQDLQLNDGSTVSVLATKVSAVSHLSWRVADCKVKVDYTGASKPRISTETEAASELMG